MRKMFFILLGAAVCAAVHGAEPIQEAFQKGLFEEEANQNLPAAIKAYESVLAQMEQQRRLAATTVFRLGECYRKLNKTNEAVALYQRVLREFSDQAALNTIARQNLAALGAGTPPGGAVPGFPVPNRAEDPGTSAESQELARLKEMLRHSPDLLNATFEPAKPSPLKNAVTKGYVSVVEFLLKSGVDVSLKDSDGATALHHAAKQGHLTITEMLIAAGSDLQARGQYGWSPLHSAAYNGHRAIVELLTDIQALNAARARHQARLFGKTETSPPTPVVDLNIGDESNSTPLHLAASRGFNAVVDLLINRGALVDSRDNLGQTPLHYAVNNNQPAIIETLVGKGADVNARITGVVRPANEGGDTRGATALHLAVKSKSLIDLLLSLKADPNARASNSRTPLNVAIQSRQRQAAIRLVEAGTELDSADSKAGSPLWWTLNTIGPSATGTDRAEATELLEAILARKPDVNRAHEGRTPLQLAVGPGMTDAVKMLLEAGADPNLKTPQGGPPLHIAVQNNKWPEAELLLKHKADPNLKDSSGSTPLHYAVRGRKELVELLIANGADVNARNQDGLTPLEQLLNPAASSDRFPTQSNQPLPYRVPISPAQLEMSRLLIRNGAQGKRPYGPEQATGEPMPSGGLQFDSSPFAWRPQANRSGMEWLCLEYEKSVKLVRLEIKDSSPSGVLRKASVFDQSGGETVIWEGGHSAVQLGATISHLIQPNLPPQSDDKLMTKKVKLYFSIVQGAKAPEVDAVELIAADGTRQWASKATASSSAADSQ